jgi:hypothetical protein
MILTTARINFDTDVLYRRQGSTHGGVGIPVTPEPPLPRTFQRRLTELGNPH